MGDEIGILEEIHRHFEEGSLKPEQYSSLALAYIGDAVYDLIIRTLVLETGNHKVKLFHKMTSSVVKAGAQADLVKSIENDLTEEEKAVFQRGRNAKSATSAKNASIVDYRFATGFEALIGYLYLKKQMNRAVTLISLGLERTGQLFEQDTQKK
jgi:ribonuclease-3 family protein